jgi:hypothetical protein
VRTRAAFLLAVLASLTLASAAVEAQSYPTVLIRCLAATPQAEAKLRSLPQVDIIDELPLVQLEALVHASDLPLLRSLGVPFVVVHADIEAFYASRLTPPGPLDLDLGSMGGYLTYGEIEAKLDLWRASYPKLITVRQSLGKTHENRDLWVVKISANADVDENEPEILIESLIHAREPSGMMSMMRCAEYLLERYGKDAAVTDLLDNREIWYIPVVNPDGYEYNRSTNPNGGGMWRKNMYRSGSTLYGVDLNRNWGYQWGYDNRGSSPTPSSTTYRGTGPFSEPETKTISDFITARTAKGMTTAWDIHTYGGLLMWPYGYANVLSPRHATYGELGADMNAENNYTIGPIYSTIYPANGGTVDWFEGAAGLWGWTPEIGHSSDGFWPPTARILALAEENLHMLLTGIRYAGPYLILKSSTLTEVGNNNNAFDPGEKIEVTCVVRNRGVVAATAAKVRLESRSAFVAMEVPSADLGNIPTVTDASNAGTPLRARILEATPPGTDLRLDLVLDFNGHQVRMPLGVFCGAGKTLVDDTCEVGGWVTGLPGDTATTGKWDWGDPYATYATSNRKFLVQVGDDHTPGTGRYCYVTGNANTTSGDQDDVDGGKTSLMTQALDLSGARNPYVEYWRWFMDHGPKPNNDAFVISVSDDDGSTWKEVERVTYSDQAWRLRSFRLRDYVKPTAKVRLLFVAADDPDDSYCEALVDDLKVTDYDDGVRLTLGGSTKIGQTANLDLTASRSGGRPYVVGASFAETPGISVAGPRTIPLAPDGLFYLFWSLPSVFRNFAGTLTTAGTGQAQIAIPANAALVGLTIHAAFVTIDSAAPAGIRDISEAIAVQFAAKD